MGLFADREQTKRYLADEPYIIVKAGGEAPQYWNGFRWTADESRAYSFGQDIRRAEQYRASLEKTTGAVMIRKSPRFHI